MTVPLVLFTPLKHTPTLTPTTYTREQTFQPVSILQWDPANAPWTNGWSPFPGSSTLTYLLRAGPFSSNYNGLFSNHAHYCYQVMHVCPTLLFINKSGYISKAGCLASVSGSRTKRDNPAEIRMVGQCAREVIVRHSGSADNSSRRDPLRLEANLVYYARTRWNNEHVLKCLGSPLEKLESFFVALKLHLLVLL